MKQRINCTICGKLINMSEAEVNFSKELYCRDCWEDWEIWKEDEEDEEEFSKADLAIDDYKETYFGETYLKGGE